MELKERVEDYLEDCTKPFYTGNKDESVAIIKDQPIRIKELEDALEFIEFSTHMTCHTFNGKECEANTKQAYEEHLDMIGDYAKKTLNKTGK